MGGLECVITGMMDEFKTLFARKTKVLIKKKIIKSFALIHYTFT